MADNILGKGERGDVVYSALGDLLKQTQAQGLKGLKKGREISYEEYKRKRDALLDLEERERKRGILEEAGAKPVSGEVGGIEYEKPSESEDEQEYVGKPITKNQSRFLARLGTYIEPGTRVTEGGFSNAITLGLRKQGLELDKKRFEELLKQNVWDKKEAKAAVIEQAFEWLGPPSKHWFGLKGKKGDFKKIVGFLKAKGFTQSDFPLIWKQAGMLKKTPKAESSNIPPKVKRDIAEAGRIAEGLPKTTKVGEDTLGLGKEGD